MVWNKVYLLSSAPPGLQQDEVALQGQWFAALLHLGHWGFPGMNKASQQTVSVAQRDVRASSAALQ